jgi:formiminotetrahydrofolate cyclodeaminase
MAAGLRTMTIPNMKTDLTTALALAKAALEGALANVAINLDSMKPESAEDEGFVSSTRKRAGELQGQA